MQENKFEKEVRQRLDELSLTPSEPVWQKIETSIRKKRERRIVFWILPLLVITGGMVWWQTTTWQSEKQDKQKAIETVQPKQTFSKPHAAQPAKKDEVKTAEVKKLSHLKTKNTYAAIESGIKKRDNKTNTIREKNHSKKEQAPDKITYKNIYLPNGNKITAQSIKDTDAVAQYKTRKDVAQPHSKTEIKTNASAVPDTSDKISAAESDSLKKAVQQNHKNNLSKKNLQWSVVSRIGASNGVEKIFSGFGGMKSMRESNAGNDYSSGGVLPGNNFDTAVRRSSAPRKGLQFSIGALLKKRIGKRSFLTTGLQYSFYSNHLVVGAVLPVDSVIGNNNSLSSFALQTAYRNNGTQNRFTNSFHFIELPIGFQYPLLKKYPLHLQHGFTVSQLVGSKALQYDSFSNAYYQSQNGLRKTGFAFFTAIDYTVWKGESFSLQAGPHLQWGLRSISKNASANSHLVSGGLAVNMAF